MTSISNENDKHVEKTTKTGMLKGDAMKWIGLGMAFLALFLCIFVLIPAANRRSDRIMETVVHVSYAQQAAEGCPAVAPRMKEMLADGRVTRDEADVIGTLLDQARAAPGGIDTCRYERWRNIFDN